MDGITRLVSGCCWFAVYIEALFSVLQLIVNSGGAETAFSGPTPQRLLGESKGLEG